MQASPEGPLRALSNDVRHTLPGRRSADRTRQPTASGTRVSFLHIFILCSKGTRLQKNLISDANFRPIGKML